MKPLRSALIAAALVAGSLPLLASAQPVTPPARSGFSLNEQTTGLQTAAQGTGLFNICAGGAQDCVARVVGNAVNVVLSLTGFLLLGYFLYGSITRMTACGDADKVKKAKNILTNAVAGLVITGLSYAIASFVLGQLLTALGQAPSTPTGTEGTTKTGP